MNLAEFSSIWKWITYCNDVMNDVDVTFTRKMCIRFLKISVGYQFFFSKNIRCISKMIYHG